MTEILILDYNRPEELQLLLESIKEKANFDKKVVVLNNGGDNYAEQFKEEGLIDKLINNPIGIGCGGGTVQLFAQCESEFAFYIQVDQILLVEISEAVVDGWKNMIRNGYYYIDLAGDQGHGQYSERAQFISKENYFKAPINFGGPGPLDCLKWSEESIQDYMKENNLEYFSQFARNSFHSNLSPVFMDNGHTSVRKNPDGSQWSHRCDLKILKCLKKPTEEYTFPPLTKEEWKQAINGDWPIDGKVPEAWKDNVFQVWK